MEKLPSAAARRGVDLADPKKESGTIAGSARSVVRTTGA